VTALTGQTILDIDRVGKYLVFILDQDAFISHLRMEGKYNIVDASKPLSKHEHLTFVLSDGTELRYQDTRKFGRLALVNKESYRQDLPLCKLGPEPWDADPKAIYARIHQSNLPIKTLLLDQTIMTGIGNIYANEICFTLKINPTTPAIVQGGTTIHSFDANGITGLFQMQLQVHLQKVCPVCNGAVIKKMVRGRGTYYCPTCQKKKG